MRYLFLTSLFHVLLFSATSVAKEKFQASTRVQVDSVVALKNSISFFEAGLQRGEIEPALDVISDNYKDAGILMTKEAARSKMSSIIFKKKSAIGESSIHAGIFFSIEAITFENSKAQVSLRISVISPTFTAGAIEEISSRLEFERSGGGWLLKSSDGLFSKILRFYDKLGKTPVATEKAGRKSEVLEVGK